MLDHGGVLDQGPFPGLVSLNQLDWLTDQVHTVRAKLLAPERYIQATAITIVFPQQVELAVIILEGIGVDRTTQLCLTDKGSCVWVNKWPCRVITHSYPNALAVHVFVTRHVVHQEFILDLNHARCPGITRIEY